MNLISADARLQIVDFVDARADLKDEVAKGKVDVVITRAAEAGATERWSELLFAYPRLRLLALSKDARTAFIHRLVLERTVLPDVSPEELLDALNEPDEVAR
jgi:hypothetical protein